MINNGHATVAYQSAVRIGPYFGVAVSPFDDQWNYLTWNKLDAFGRDQPPLGVGWQSALIGSGRGTGIAIPFSYLALLFSILPILALRSHLHRRKIARLNLCPKCSYDLRVHAPDSLCPECGTRVTNQRTAAAPLQAANEIRPA